MDNLCAQPDPACVTRYFTQIVYAPRQMSYRGLPKRVELPVSEGADWCPLRDSLESHDRHYRQLFGFAPVSASALGWCGLAALGGAG